MCVCVYVVSLCDCSNQMGVLIRVCASVAWWGAMRATDCNAMLQSVPLPTTETNCHKNHYHAKIPPHPPPLHPHTLLEHHDNVNKQVKHRVSLNIKVCHSEAPDSIIIIQDVFIPVNIMKHFDTMGYTSLFRCQCHPYWRTRAGGGMCAGVRGQKGCSWEKIGGGDVNVTSWFIVLSCHRQACIRSFPFLCFFFSFFEGGGVHWCYYGCLISQVPIRADTN